VAHPVEPLADVRRADARSAQIGGPDSISQCFQVKAYSSEPFTPKFARNLFSSDNWRVALRDKPEHLGPEVAFVGGSGLGSGDAEGLARAGARPDGALPLGEDKRVRPPADAGEEVALLIARDIRWRDFGNTALIYVTIRDCAELNKHLEPGGSKRVFLIVIDTLHDTAVSSGGGSVPGGYLNTVR